MFKMTKKLEELLKKNKQALDRLGLAIEKSKALYSR